MRFVLATLASLVLTAPAFGQDGSAVAGGNVTSGSWNIAEYLLCDGAAADCPVIDLHTGPASSNSWAGLPHHMTVSLRVDNCETTANDVEIQLNSRSDITTAAGLATSVGAHTPGTLSWDACGGGSCVTAIPIDQLTHRYIRGEILATGTGVCTDFEVVLIMFYPRPTH